MKLERTKNSLRSLISGVINKIILLIMPFIVRTIFIKTLGIEYLGLNSLFISLLNILNLAELGVGSAIVFNLYGAIANNDKEEICSLMNFYKKIYRYIGLFVITIGVGLLPFLKYFCDIEKVPGDINIYLIYILHLINSALSYFLYSYKNCLLIGFQQLHISNNVNTIVKIVLNILQGLFLVLGKSYYIYVILIILATMMENILNAIIVTKKFPEYKSNGNISKNKKEEIYNKVKALFLYKIGGVVLTSVDSIIISAFLGLTILGKYNNYYYVISTLFGFFQVYYNAMLAGVGNSIASESIEKNKKDFEKLNFIQGWLVGWCSICLVCLYQHFIRIWIGEDNLFAELVPIFLAIYFYVWKMMDIVNLYKEAAGLWEYDKYRPIIAAIINLIINIILVRIIHIYGIIISTILAIIGIILPWSVVILYKVYFKEKSIEFWKNYIINIFVTVVAGVITYVFCSILNRTDLLGLIIKCVVCVLIPNVIYFVLYYKNNNFIVTKKWVIDKIKR